MCVSDFYCNKRNASNLVPLCFKITLLFSLISDEHEISILLPKWVERYVELIWKLQNVNVQVSVMILSQ